MPYFIIVLSDTRYQNTHPEIGGNKARMKFNDEGEEGKSYIYEGI